MKTLKIQLLLLTTLVVPQLSFAASPSEPFESYIQNQITVTHQAFEQACSEEVQTQSESSVAELKQLFLTLSPHVSFGIKDVLDVEVAPEITLVWEKSLY